MNLSEVFPWHYFTDPVLRAPTLGSMLMCLASSLIGVIVFLRKRSLLGEALSHASYPGIVFSVIAAASLFPAQDDVVAVTVLIGAFLFSLLGMWVIDFLENKMRVRSDAALCLVLSIFFGIGILAASRIQVTHALWYKQAQVFLYGQAATMTDVHIGIYALLCLVVITVLVLLYRPIEAVNFDRDFALSLGLRVRKIENLLFILLALAIVIGIRCVGVVLMSGMLIAPPAAARQYSHRLWKIFLLSGFFGLFSGFLGNYLSVEIPIWVGDGKGKFSLPTGPMILICASLICLLSLLFAPKRGLTVRWLRVIRFKDRCQLENILKCVWKKGRGAVLSRKSDGCMQSSFALQRLIWKGWLEKTSQGYRLTEIGWKRASALVRLHRLWEVYLVDYVGQRAEKVHRSAEEMEHILTPELEAELTKLLHDPKKDPHQQPIPDKEF